MWLVGPRSTWHRDEDEEEDEGGDVGENVDVEKGRHGLPRRRVAQIGVPFVLEVHVFDVRRPQECWRRRPPCLWASPWHPWRLG